MKIEKSEKIKQKEKKRSYGKLTLDILSGYFHLIANITVNIVLFPFILHHFGKGYLGLFLLLLNLSNLAGLAISWMGSPVIKFVGEFQAKENWDQVSNYYSAGKSSFCLYGLFIGLVTFVLAPFGAQWLLDPGGPIPLGELILCIRFIAIFIILNFTLQADLLLLAALMKFRVANIFRTLMSLMNGLFIFIACHIYQPFHGIIIALILSITITAVLTTIFLKKSVGHIRWKPLPPLSVLRKIFLEVGGAYFLSTSLFMIFLQMDPYLIKNAGNLALVAFFGIIWKIPETITNLQWRFTDTLQPYIVNEFHRGESDFLLTKYRQIKKWILGVSVLFILLYTILGPFIIRLWLGAVSVPDKWYFFFIPAVGTLFLSSNKLDHMVALSVGKLNNLIIFQFVEIIAKLCGMIFFLRWGCLSPLIGYLFIQTILYFLYRRNSINLLRNHE